ncbi:glutamate synthase (NADPH/NADH) small chain [Fibrobacter sp. UWB16]|uniref:glutamate synthase subunit beta n=1 Tax=Fibrobacter sp. UWB16 TaxID=1945874 RepID=UPI000BDAA5CB|nr:glutamate synthase subunit beta [Fibrobacter sp. UWB16]SOD14650.1 glutamate synthase (NADPH/NADH) small chain [Fibrobacter sp. UWB16]
METVQRIQDVYRPVDERVKDVKEVERSLTAVEIVAQAGRCSNCGVPFCHGAGCPLGNLVPEFNEAVAAGDIRKGYDIISKTAFFPEFTGRVCPALCESCCTRNLNDDAVMVRQVEKFMIETAFEEGWVSLPTAEPNGKTAAVIGAGPAGLFAAEALRRKGFAVTVYEKHEKPGGLLRYGIPNWKLEKQVIDRRVALLEAAGIKFICNTEIGKDISAEYIHRNFDYTFLAIGTPNARDLKIPGREAEGIYLALDYLHGAEMPDCKDPEKYNAKGKKVLIIGGGDTGNDCVGKAIREGCKSVLQVEFMPKPPETRSPSTPWPDWPYLLRTSYAHHEGGERRWNVSSKQFIVKDGHVAGVEAVRVEWDMSPLGKPLKPNEVPNSTEIIEADLVVLAMGFTGVPAEGLVNDLGLKLTPRTAIIPDPARNIYAVGDCANGASLVVRAMASAKQVVNRLK